MKWVLGIVLGLVAVSLVSRLVINLSPVARRVRKLGRFAYGVRPDVFNKPRGDLTDFIDEASKSYLHFDLACLCLLARRQPPHNEDEAVALDVLRAWDEARARAGRVSLS